MKTFIGIVHKEKDSAYGIHFPDAAGCYSASDSLDELMAEASKALAFYFEGVEVTEPRDADAMLADPEIKQELDEGAFLLAVPLIEMTGRKVPANMTFDAGLLAAIDQTCKLRGMTRSAFLADLARRAITQETPEA